MRLKFLLIVSTILISCAAPSPSSSKQILSQHPDWNELAQSSYIPGVSLDQFVTLRLGDTDIGTGFIFDSERRLILTAGHVAAFLKEASGSTFSTVNCENVYLSCNIVADKLIDTNIDIAILIYVSSFDVHAPSVSLARDPTEGSAIHVVGDNTIEKKLYDSNGSFYQGDTTESVQQQFEHSCDTLPGFSGGPIFNQNGQLVGIHKGFNGVRNYGIKAAAFSSYLN